MTEPRSPDDEPIIELTEVVEPSATDDDDILELTEVVEPSAIDDDDILELTEVVESASTPDGEIIELTEVVDTVPQAEEKVIELANVVAPPSAGDEDIIDLTEVVDPAPTAQDGRPEQTAFESAPPAEDDVIDLVEVVGKTAEVAADDGEDVAMAFDEPAVGEPDETPEPAADPAPDPATASEVPVFDLFDESALIDADAPTAPETELDFAPMDLDIEETKNEDLFDSLGMKLEPDLQSGEDHDELDFNLSTQELSDAIDLLDAKLAEEPAGDAPVSMGPTEALSSTVSQAQLENALENVIRKMYAEKIDLLLNEAIEKNVSAEIKRLKEQLLTDSPED